MKKLIITADDYGVFPSINLGVIEAVKAGKVNSVACFANYKDSVTNVKKLLNETDEKVDVGCHLTITSGKPVTGDKASSMCNKGNFRDYSELRKKIDLVALENELQEQINVFKNAGIKVKHLSCHHNSLTLFQEFYEVYMKVARDNKLPMRSPVIIPESETRAFILMMRARLLENISLRDNAELKKFSKEIAQFFKDNANGIKTTSHLESSHYGPVPFDNILPGRVTKIANNKRKELKSLLNDFAISADESKELMLHLIKEDIRNIDDYWDIDYTGVNRKYFDSRIVEFESIMKYDYKEHPELKIVGWSDL